MAETSADSQEVGGSRNPKLNIFCAFLREQTTIADLSTHSMQPERERPARNPCFFGQTRRVIRALVSDLLYLTSDD
jgi:hypothetical protein